MHHSWIEIGVLILVSGVIRGVTQSINQARALAAWRLANGYVRLRDAYETIHLGRGLSIIRPKKPVVADRSYRP